MKLDRADADAHVLSFPKTGRTWLRIMLGEYLCARHGIGRRLLTATPELTEACKLWRTSFTHGEAAFHLRVRASEVRLSGSWFAGKRVIVLVRDIRDTMVSAYLWSTRRMRAFDGSISSYIRDEYIGAPKFLACHRHWYEVRDTGSSFACIRYEDMHRDPGNVLAQVLSWLGEVELDRSLIDDAVGYGSFENMRKLEAQGRNLSFGREIATTHGGDPEAFKIRRGKVGRFADYLSPEDISYLDSLNEAEGCPLTRATEG